MYENRNFMVFSVSELDKIDFSQVLETSTQTVRKSVDEIKTFVKWDGAEPPACISTLTTAEGPYTYGEMLELLSGEEWSSPISDMPEG